ncbi:arginyl-tRNA--protein transferase 1 isoform X2 [Anabrus simplex]|uniref:arginyl-tRNA--protein transferase 1 isoform X2 n=1 Tax=Anabrus simplex TaxID=316456 RepID=UPI0035A2995D
MSLNNYSVVEYYAEHEKHRCGYCKSTDTNYSHGMWAHMMTVQDYQDLIDRGWRRSGRYCYKPTMNVTCCPMYTIKCSALEFKLSKSQKKVLKRFHRYLAHGCTKASEDTISAGESSATSEPTGETFEVNDIPDLHQKSLRAEKNAESAKVMSVDPSLAERTGVKVQEEQVPRGDSVSSPLQDNSVDKDSTVKEDQEVPKPPCKKAKLMRLERKKQKLVRQGYSEQEVEQMLLDSKKPPPQGKTLEDFLNESLPDEPAHRLELMLVSVDSREFIATLAESQQLYAKYQVAVHKETPEECNIKTFYGFLVDSPLQSWTPSNGPPNGYGSFHQQYWLDGRLVAVGVIDILPRCVSSVYFFYDPDLSQLSLGTYASLQELSLVRSLHHNAPDLQYYYMGFYIHTCPKMRYKANYCPSFLLCPETYTWHPVEKCKPKLDVSRYCRFEEDPTVVDADGSVVVSEVLVLSHNKAMPYFIYQTKNRDLEDVEETKQYASLVGMKCAKRMLLVKN